MSKSEILHELTRLTAAERLDILEQLTVMCEADLINEAESSSEENKILDKAWADHQAAPDAGSTPHEVLSRLKNG